MNTIDLFQYKSQFHYVLNVNPGNQGSRYYFTMMLSRFYEVTTDGVWIGQWIYSTLRVTIALSLILTLSSPLQRALSTRILRPLFSPAADR
jgi:hypothetical protein